MKHPIKNMNSNFVMETQKCTVMEPKYIFQFYQLKENKRITQIESYSLKV